MLMVAADGEPPLVFTEMPPIYPPARPSYPISSSPSLLLSTSPPNAHTQTHTHRLTVLQPPTAFARVPRDINTAALPPVCAAYTVAIKEVSVGKHVTQHSCPICECQWVNAEDRWGIINASVMI